MKPSTSEIIKLFRSSDFVSFVDFLGHLERKGFFNEKDNTHFTNTINKLFKHTRTKDKKDLHQTENDN